MNKPSLEAIRRLMEHDRTRTSWVCNVVEGKINRIARICVQYPAKGRGEGRLRVAVTDWGNLDSDHSPHQFIGQASGYGYDKLTAALQGATVGGFELGDHCTVGKSTLKDLCYREGWEVIGEI